MSAIESQKPVPRVRQHVVTAIVNGKPRHRILGIELHHGQTHESLDAATRKKVEKIAVRFGMDLLHFADWWWYSPTENGPPEQRLIRGDVILEEGERGGRQYRSYSDPLSFYARRGHITAAQRKAGERLYSIWRVSAMACDYRVMRFDDTRGAYQQSGGKALLNPAYRKAMDSVRGTRERTIVYDVCCTGRLAGKGQMEKLRSALDDLAKHFRIES